MHYSVDKVEYVLINLQRLSCVDVSGHALRRYHEEALKDPVAHHTLCQLPTRTSALNQTKQKATV